MSRRKPKWKRPVSKPAWRVELPKPRKWSHDDTMKARYVSQDVVLRMDGLTPIFNSGAYSEEEIEEIP